MMRRSAAAFVALILLSGCTGTRTPKLAKCTGPYRYANPHGTVLPTLPIPGQVAPASAATSPMPTPIPDALASPAPNRPQTDPPAPATSSALLTQYPSC